ncbi:MAG: hypothetical protein AABX00_03870 [Nanoarchaeota archaeon]
MKQKTKDILLKFGLIPHYEEDTLFLMSIAAIILFLISFDLRSDFFYFFTGSAAITIISILIGIYVSIYNAFSNKKKPTGHKFFMLFFAVIINSYIGFKSGTYILSKSSDLWIIFPILNILNSVSLILLFKMGVINENSISDENTNYWELVIGSFVLITIIFISNFIYKNYWAITFSMSVAYATNFNNIIINSVNAFRKLRFSP